MKCKDCGQPMLPKGKVKKLNEYDHAQGCPSGRDPRVEPRVGDVLKGKNGGRAERRIVTSVAASMVMYTRGSRTDAYMGKGTESCRPERTWRAWAKNAEVIHRAD